MLHIFCNVYFLFNALCTYPIFFPVFFFSLRLPYSFSLIPPFVVCSLSASPLYFFKELDQGKTFPGTKAHVPLLYFLDVCCPLRYYTQERGHTSISIFFRIPRSTFNVLYFTFPVSRPTSHFSPLFPSFRSLGPFDQRHPFSYIYFYMYNLPRKSVSSNKYGVYVICVDRKSTRLNSSHSGEYRMPSSA